MEPDHSLARGTGPVEAGWGSSHLLRHYPEAKHRAKLGILINTRLAFHKAPKLFKGGEIPPYKGKTDPPPPANASLIQQPWGPWNWPLTVSTPERAILELLDEVPKRETFHQADVLMEGLRNLSPRRLQALLTECRSLKVRRLFLWLRNRSVQF